MKRIEEVCQATDKMYRDQTARMLREAGAGYDNRPDDLVGKLRKRGWEASAQGLNVSFNGIIGTPYEYWELMMEAFEAWRWTAVSPPPPSA